MSLRKSYSAKKKGSEQHRPDQFASEQSQHTAAKRWSPLRNSHQSER